MELKVKSISGFLTILKGGSREWRHWMTRYISSERCSPGFCLGSFVYLNDLPRMTSKCNINMYIYADDVAIYCWVKIYIND